MSSILVIDDDRAVLHIFKQLYSKDNVELLTAKTAAEGLNLVRERVPDVVFLDLMLPDVSGLDALAEIRQFDVRIPVILITAGGTSDTAIEAMKNGAVTTTSSSRSTWPPCRNWRSTRSLRRG